MISVSNLSKSYKGIRVLNIENLDIPKGQSFGLVGNNGAGKTTFFSLLLDLIQPTTGHIKNKEILVNDSEDWKPFTSSFIDESFLIGYLNSILFALKPFFLACCFLQSLHSYLKSVFLLVFLPVILNFVIAGLLYLPRFPKPLASPLLLALSLLP